MRTMPLMLFTSALLGGCPAKNPALTPHAAAIVADLQPTLEVHDGREVWMQIPPSPRAVMFLFHGGGGSAAHWLTRTEARWLLTSAIDRGYGWVALDSMNRDRKRFTPPTKNGESIDLDNLRMVRSDLIGAGRLPPGTPEVALGISNGGAWASFLAVAEPDLDAVVIVSARGQREFLERIEPDTAVFFAHMASDPLIAPQDVQGHHNLLLERGIHSGRYMKESEPMNADRLTRIAGIDERDAQQILEVLRNAQVINGEGRIPEIPDKNSRWHDVLPAGYADFEREIGDQLMGAFSAHTLDRALFEPIFRFLEQWFTTQDSAQ